MPYRLDPDNPRCVQVENEEGSWERVEGGCQESREEAEEQLAALRINVDDEDTEESVSETRDLTEVYEPGFAFREGETSVDRDQRVIRDVSLLGRTSRNNRTYSSTAMREAAEQHNNIGVFLDHPTKTEERERGGTRSVRDLAGRVTRATVEGDRVKGDIQVAEGSEGDKILSLAEQMPGVVGFSHRAKGKIRRGEDGDVVESVEAVHGADLVTDPATVSGLFEQIEDDTQQEDEMDGLAELDADTLREERPDLVEQIRESEDEADLAEENQKLREELDRLRAEQAEREHRELVDDKIDESGLPDRAVTDTFRESLMEADEEDKIDALIADRRELVEAARKGGPTSKSRDPDELFEDVSGDVDGEALQEAFETLW